MFIDFLMFLGILTHFAYFDTQRLNKQSDRSVGPDGVKAETNYSYSPLVGGTNPQNFDFLCFIQDFLVFLPLCFGREYGTAPPRYFQTEYGIG